MIKDDTRIFAGYVIGIISIVSSFFQPLMGLVLGIIGVVSVRKSNDKIAKKARMMNIVGIVLGAIFFGASLWLMIKTGQLNIPFTE